MFWFIALNSYWRYDTYKLLCSLGAALPKKYSVPSALETSYAYSRRSWVDAPLQICLSTFVSSTFCPLGVSEFDILSPNTVVRNSNLDGSGFIALLKTVKRSKIVISQFHLRYNYYDIVLFNAEKKAVTWQTGVIKNSLLQWEIAKNSLSTLIEIEIDLLNVTPIVVWSLLHTNAKKIIF